MSKIIKLLRQQPKDSEDKVRTKVRKFIRDPETLVKHMVDKKKRVVV